MLWLDYREKLNIGFDNREKAELLITKIINRLTDINDIIIYTDKSYFDFCMMAGYEYSRYGGSFFNNIIDNFRFKHLSLQEFVSIYIAFINTFEESPTTKWGSRKEFIDLLTTMMKESGIGFDVLQDGDGYFIFPQGAPELDNALVSAPLDWLSKYQKAHKTFCIALKQYSNGEYIRDTADNFRKALEAFLQEFFNNKKNLSNNIAEIGAFLKSNGAETEITNIIIGLVKAYDALNNKIAKHDDKVDEKFLEFLMYQTGIIIRMLIIVKQKSQPASNNI